MPNYVINQINISGEQNIIDSLLEDVKSEQNVFDFDRIKPRPKSLDIESGTDADRSLAVYIYELNGDDSLLKEYLTYPWAYKKTIDEVVEYIKMIRYIEDLGKAAYENILNYGCKDWYDWNRKNWGTKWNSSYSTVDGNSIRFQTAWCTPYPIIDLLSKKYPDLTFNVKYADESIGSNCGVYELKDGQLILDEEGDIVFACGVWGYDPADYDESYYRDKVIDTILDKKDE